MDVSASVHRKGRKYNKLTTAVVQNKLLQNLQNCVHSLVDIVQTDRQTQGETERQ